MFLINSLLATIMHYLPKSLVRPFAKPYVAGENINSVIKTVKKLNDDGFSTTIDILGEFVNSEEEADKTEISDQSKYLADQKVEVLKTLN